MEKKSKTEVIQLVHKQIENYGSYFEMEDLFLGYCLSCGEETSGVEPDARGYECECCGASEVLGLEEFLLMHG